MDGTNYKKKSFYESSLLKINSNKSKKIIKWKCILTFSETMQMVVNWYKTKIQIQKIFIKQPLTRLKIMRNL